MSRAVGHVGQGVLAPVNSMRWTNAGALLVLLLCITACGGGSGQSSAPPSSPSSPSAPASPTPPPVSPPSASRGTLAITVTNVLGAPIAGAEVWINSDQPNEDKWVTTDGTGKVEVTGIYAGLADVQASSSDAYGLLTRVVIPANAVQQITVVAVPAAEGASGVSAARVIPGSVSDDGRTVEFAVSIIQVPHASSAEYWAWGPDAIRVVACAPDPANDKNGVRPDCVSGEEGFDAAYSGLDEGRAVSILRNRAPQHVDGIHRPLYKTALLLDQSSGVIESDPADRRLFATKYLLRRSDAERRFAVAGFATDDAASGQPALLPQKPVTILPVENPGFMSDGRALFPEVDSLSALEGGGAPVLAAIDRMLDFGARGPEEQASLIVITDGRDKDCTAPSQCRARRDALLQKSRDKGVTILTVGLARSPGDWDRESLAFAAQQGSEGAAFWAHEPRQLAPVLDVAERFLRNEVDTLNVSFRIRSEAAGTFVSGRTILGHVRFEICPFDCSYTYVPFAITIR